MMTTTPTVSIVTRTRERPRFLARAAESVLGQRFGDWEWIVVNDAGARGPVDDLLATHAARFAGRARALHREQSTGMEAASNAGLREARGEYVVIHDDDDTWAPEFLQTCVAFLREQAALPGLGGVIAHSVRVVERVDGDRIVEVARDSFNTWLDGVTLFRLAGHNLFPPISFVYRRAILDELGYYREDLPVLGDWEFNLRFVARYEIAVIQQPLANYHHRLAQAGGAGANTVVAGEHRHRYFDARVRNQLMRGELASGAPGLGMLLGAAQGFEEVARLLGKQRETFYVYLKDKLYHLATTSDLFARVARLGELLGRARSRE
jgi:glycosyltransferase involved in cell wall biosynthesis